MVATFMQNLVALFLSGSSGVRATYPLLIVAISIAMNPQSFDLSSQMSWLGSNWTIVVMAILSVVEFILDKIPGLDHCLHVAMVPIHTVVGGLISVAPQDIGSADWSAWLVGIIGAGFALLVHLIKAAIRVGSTGTSGGLANPCVSLIEDVILVITIILAILVAILAVIFLGVLIVLLVYGCIVIHRRRVAARSNDLQNSNSLIPVAEVVVDK